MATEHWSLLVSRSLATPEDAGLRSEERSADPSSGEPRRTRTFNQLIKSQLLYH